MSIISNPEMYRSTEKQWAQHPLPNYPNGFEMWYNNASFDNGYHASIFWGIVAGNPLLDLRVCNSKGKLVVESTQFLNPSDAIYSTESLDIKIGDNYYRGKFPSYEHSIHDGDNGAELVYESLTQPTIAELPDGIVLGHEATPDTLPFFSWFFRPRCKVSGKLIVAGKEIPVSGEGLSEHEWSTGSFLDAFHYWSFGCLPIGEHTLVYMEGHLSEKLGYQKAKWLWDWKGGKFYEYCRDCDYYIQKSDLAIDEGTGKPYPQKLVLMFEHSRIKGTITCDLKTIMQKQLYPGEEWEVLYTNGVYDCHAQMEIDDEKIDTKFSRMLETAF